MMKIGSILRQTDSSSVAYHYCMGYSALVKGSVGSISHCYFKLHFASTSPDCNTQ